MSDLDEIRQKRMAELQAQQAAMQNQQMQQQQAAAQAQQQEAQRQQFEAQKKQILGQIMTPEARTRLGNLKLTKPELVEQIELQLIQSAQSGSLRGKVTDDQLKVLLRQIYKEIISMKAGVLYSGGKDSSFMAVMLKRLGLEVELCTANFGVYKSYIPASKSAKSLGFNHRVLDLDIELLDKTCDMIMDDGFPNDGIKYIHENVIENVAEEYDIIADGTRRDDRTPKLNVNQIRSLEDRKNVQYINLDSFGHKSVKLITSNLFEISHEKSNKDNSSDYEVEIRTLIDEKGGNSLDIFPEHYQTRVIGYK